MYIAFKCNRDNNQSRQVIFASLHIAEVIVWSIQAVQPTLQQQSDVLSPLLLPATKGMTDQARWTYGFPVTLPDQARLQTATVTGISFMQTCSKISAMGSTSI